MLPFIREYPEVDIGVPRSEANGLARPCFASMDFRRDLAPLFPFVHGAIAGAKMWSDPHMVVFPLGDWKVRLYPRLAVSGPFADRGQAHELAGRLMDTLNDIHARQDEIIPRHGFLTYSSPLDVLRLLPRTSCGDCGYRTCLAFAAFVSRGYADIDDCPHTARPVATRLVYPVLDADGRVVSTVELDARIRPVAHPVEDPAPETGPEDLPDPPWPFGEDRGLTGRELEVLRLIVEGFTNRQICQALEISQHTVKSHVDHIFNKLGVFDRTQAAVWAVRNNIVP